jgi:hypothetical protein
LDLPTSSALGSPSLPSDIASIYRFAKAEVEHILSAAEDCHPGGAKNPVPCARSAPYEWQAASRGGFRNCHGSDAAFAQLFQVEGCNQAIQLPLMKYPDALLLGKCLLSLKYNFINNRSNGSCLEQVAFWQAIA